MELLFWATLYLPYDVSQSTVASSAMCRQCTPLLSFVWGQESKMCDVAAVTHFIACQFFWHVSQWSRPVRNRFSNDHWRQGRWKQGSRIVGSSIVYTNEELTSVADCQSSQSSPTWHWICHVCCCSSAGRLKYSAKKNSFCALLSEQNQFWRGLL